MAGERGGRTGRNAPAAAESGPDAATPPVEPVTPPVAEAPPSDVPAADPPPAAAPPPAPDAPTDGQNGTVAADVPPVAPDAAPAADAPPADVVAATPVAEPLTISTVAADDVDDEPVTERAGRLIDDLLAEAERATAAGQAEIASALHVADIRLREFAAILGQAIDAVEHPDLERRLISLWHLIH